MDGAVGGDAMKEIAEAVTRVCKANREKSTWGGSETNETPHHLMHYKNCALPPTD